jgi:hypothetical protein
MSMLIIAIEEANGDVNAEVCVDDPMLILDEAESLLADRRNAART